MIVLAIYAAFVWYLAVRYRRRWQGFAAVILGVLAIWLVVGVVQSSRDPGVGLGKAHQILTLLWAEMVIVASVGLYMACLPRRRREMDCRSCGYDLSGLDPFDLKCPECGCQWTGRGSAVASDPSQTELTPIPKAGSRRAGI